MVPVKYQWVGRRALGREVPQWRRETLAMPAQGDAEILQVIGRQAQQQRCVDLVFADDWA
jgi:hypothetical protein